MADAGYAAFFIAVLLSSPSLMHVTIHRDWRRIAAAVRGEPLCEAVVLPPAVGRVRLREQRALVLQPVKFHGHQVYQVKVRKAL